jgi:hypothetical protein
VLVAIWLAWRSRERFRTLAWVGLRLGPLGLGLVVGAGHWSSRLGMGISLLNPLSWAVYLILLPRLLGPYRPLTLATLITVLGAVMLVPLGVVQVVWWTRTQRLRTASALALEMQVGQIESPPASQRIAPQTRRLHQLGLSQAATSQRLGVSDKTIWKAISWTRNPPFPARCPDLCEPSAFIPTHRSGTADLLSLDRSLARLLHQLPSGPGVPRAAAAGRSRPPQALGRPTPCPALGLLDVRGKLLVPGTLVEVEGARQCPSVAIVALVAS